ncbi:peptidase family M1-domain-containing protein [Poronia punctata]|nr:peptidase family M1-domain-containing protein [Poronia punctata]
MDLIGQLPRLAVALFGGCSPPMAYQMMRGKLSSSYYHTVTQSITAITRSSDLSCRPSKQYTRNSILPTHSWPSPSGDGYTRTRPSTFCRFFLTADTWGTRTCSSSSTPADSSHLILARSSRAPIPHHHHGRQSKPRGAVLPKISIPPLSRSFSSTTRVSCSAIIPSSIMADRDILPATVKPSHYDLTISSMNFDDWSYQGEVSIHVTVAEPVKEVVLNALELTLEKAEFTLQRTQDTKILQTANFSYDGKKQRATLLFTEEIPASQKAVLKITFKGIINNDMAGFYRSKYKPVVPAAASVPKDDTFHYMFSTQFESCDARRAFPCFDEPRLKATFDFQIETPDDQVALSNMPVKDVTKTRDGFQLVSFERTPVMSTYLLAWAVGDFEYLEAFTDRKYNGKPIPVRVYTTRGLKEQGRWALEHAPKTIDLFSESFGIDYPLPKSDLLAVHEFTHGAMENWGLVTYRTTAVLFDEKTSDARYKNRVAYVVAHELAHQWFGNLVTMDWWDELWLNESFATWAGWYAVNEFHPDWQVWTQFVNEGMETAFKLDGIRASHPVHVPVQDALDVNQIFDHISYLKGCSVLRMLVNHLGEKKFLEGVGVYLRKHAYGNAKTEYLWQALSDASGANINELMSNWIEKIGHPVVTIAEEPGQISVKQNRYLSTGDVKPEEDETTWWVPLGLQGKVGEQGVQSLALTERQTTIRDVDDDFYKLNSNATGFFRTNYPPARLAKLGTQLDRLSSEDKISIIGSAADLAFSGYGSPASLLSFLQGFGQESNYLVWAQVLDSLSTLKAVFGQDDTIKKGLEAFSLKLVGDAVEKIGWEFPEGEDYLTGLLRKRLLLHATANGHAAVTQKALSVFDAWSSQGTPIHPSLRSVAYRAAIKSKPAEAVKILKKEWYNGSSIDGKEVCLASLGHTRDPEIIKNELLPFLFNISPPAPASESVPSGDMHSLASSLAANSVARDLQWEFVQGNWDQITTKMANPVVLDRFVKLTLNKFIDDKYVTEIEKFFENKDTSSFDRTLEQVKDAVRGRAAYYQRGSGLLKEWLSTNGYIN